MSKSVRDLRYENAQLHLENGRLRGKVLNQRTELRRLNRTLKAIWEGVRFNMRTSEDLEKVAKEREKNSGDERAA